MNSALVEELDSKYVAALILAEDEWDITCPIGEYTSRQDAQEALNHAKASLVEHERAGCLRISIGETELFVTDAQVNIKELPAAVQERLGPPLDMRESGSAEKAIAALHRQDPAYVINPGDYVPSRKTLSDFLARYGEGYRLEHIADSIWPVV